MLRILAVDAAEYYINLGRKLGQEIELVAETERSDDDAFTLYKPTSVTFDWIRQQIDFDVIILGNNTGAGFKKALHFSEEQISRTVVVWLTYPSDVAPYRGLGFTHFSSRENVHKEILAMINS